MRAIRTAPLRQHALRRCAGIVDGSIGIAAITDPAQTTEELFASYRESELWKSVAERLQPMESEDK